MKKCLTLLVLLFAISLSYAQEVKINNDMIVEADGTVRYANNATIFDDLMIFPDATAKSGSNPPVWTSFKNNGGGSQGTCLWMFSPTTEQEIYFTVQLPHSYKEGSTIYPHIHWTTTTGTPSGSDVVWGLEYSVITIGGTFPNTTIITTNSVINSITISGTHQHLISSFPAISGTSVGISTMIVCRLFRKAGDAADTFANATGLLGFDIHFEKDTDGSRTEFSK